MGDRTIRAILTASTDQFNVAFGKAKRSSDDLGDSLGQLDNRRQDLDRLGTTAGIAGAALIAGVAGAVKVYADFDKQMSAVAATGDDARQNLDALREAALNAGRDTAFSASEAAQGLEELAKAGVSSKDALGGGLKGALDLAAAGQLGVAEASETAATAMTQFNLSGAEVPHIADLLAAGAGKAQGSVHDMGFALKQSGLVASQFGLSIEDTTGTLAAFASAGLVGSDAGTSLKTMLLALANPSEKSAAAMAKLGIAAYDTQGNFVGVENLAGQLQTQLGGLDQATRDQALAQIFGNDAVRAANVLYKQGSAGIGEWIDKVDDQGYAAETAATKMDNLAGDLEKLKGSLEVALIGLGEGANGPLRSLTQGLDKAVQGFDKLPAPIKQGGLALAGVSGGALLAFAGLSKVVTSANDTLQAFNNLAPAGGKARGALAGAAKGAGIAAAAFVALNVAGTLIDNMGDKTVPTLEGTTAALLGVAGGGDAAGDALTGFFQTTNDAATNFYGEEKVVGLDDALSRLLDPSKSARFNDWGTHLIESLGGPAGAATQLEEKFTKVDESLADMASNGKADEAAASFTRLRDAAESQGISIDKLLTLFPKYKADLQAQANELGITTLTAEDYADWMGGKIPGAIRAAEVAARAGGKGIDNLAGAQKQAAYEAEQLQKELEGIIKSFTILEQGAIDSDEAAENFAGSLQNLKESTKGASKSLDANTDAGRKNRNQVRDAIKALNEKVSVDFKATSATGDFEKATKNATSRLKTGEAQIRAAAKAAGLNEKETDKMIKRYLKTPKEVKTDVKAPGLSGTNKGLEEMDTNVNNLNSKSITITASFKAKADKAVAALNKEIVSKVGGRQISVFSTGGTARGPGTATSDDIPAMLSDGEEVVRTWAAQRTRPALKFINTHGRLPEEHERHALHLATGGTVRHTVNASVENSLRRISSDPFEGQVDLLSKSASQFMSSLSAGYIKKLNAAAAKAAIDSGGGPYGGGGKAVGGGRGAARAAMLRLGGSPVFTYPGHQPSMNKAWDAMIQSKAEGDRIAGHLAANRKAYGISYIIWNRRMLRDYAHGSIRPGTWAPYFDGGSSNPNRAHTNHVHSSYYHGGGLVGPDEENAILQKREYVVQQKAADYYGPQLMTAMNQRQIDKAALLELVQGRPVNAPTYSRGTGIMNWNPYAAENAAAQGGRGGVNVNFYGQVGASADDVVRLIDTRATAGYAAQGVEYGG